jgi:hypothetical protein
MKSRTDLYIPMIISTVIGIFVLRILATEILKTQLSYIKAFLLSLVVGLLQMGIGFLMVELGWGALIQTSWGVLLFIPILYVFCTLIFSWVIKFADNKPIGLKKGSSASLLFVSLSTVLNMLLIPILKPLLAGFLKLS